MTKAILAAAIAFLIAVAVASMQTPGYDPAREVSASGVVRYVISTTASDGTVGVHLELRTIDGPVRVHLAPAMFLGTNNFSVFTDDTVAVRGAKVTRDGETAIWARLVIKDGRTFVLRDENGTPRWPRATDDDPDGCGITHAPVR